MVVLPFKPLKALNPRVSPNADKTLSALGEKYIKWAEEEGGKPKLKAYNDGTGTWTIAWGCTDGVHKGMTCTQDEAEAMFKREIAKHIASVHKLITIPISQGLFDALVSFFYNNGAGACQTLIMAVNSGNAARVRAAWMLYVHAFDEKKRRKTEWPGLVKRRKSELALWERVDALPPESHKPENQKKTVEIAVSPIPAGELPAGKKTPSLPPPPPNVISVATGSRSVKAQLTALVMLVGGYFTQGANQAVDGLVWLVSSMPTVATDAQTAMTSTSQMAGWLHLNSASVSVAIAVICVATALVRRILDKREQQL